MNTPLVKKVKSKFKEDYGTNPLMVFSPGRINLIGEHTDYNYGLVLPAAIDKGIVVAIQKSNSNSSSIIALDVSEHYDFSLENISPINNGGWKNYVIGIVAEIQKTGKDVENFNLVFAGDIPSGAGVSSSAALENSIVFGLNELFSLGLTKRDMVFISQKAEHNYVGVKCGVMDQYASMFGKKDSAILLDCKTLESKVITLDLKEHSLLLINTNVEHSLAESEYNERRAVCEHIAELLEINSLRDASEENLCFIKGHITEEDYQKALYIIQENQRVLQAYEAINCNDILKLGALFFDSHRGLQNQYNVSCDELNFLVDYAQSSEAIIGARMMGGGFGGCTINLVKTEALEGFKNEILNHYKQKFNTDCSFYNVHLSGGTKLI